MAARNTGRVLVRLLAIYLALQIVQSLIHLSPSLFDFGSPIFSMTPTWLYWIMLGANVMAPAVFVVALWVFAEKIASPDNLATDASLHSREDLMFVGVSLVGVVLVVLGFRQIASLEADFVLDLSTSVAFEGTDEFVESHRTTRTTPTKETTTAP